MLAHLGGVPIEESLIYLVPPLAIVGWIFLLARRDLRKPRRADADADAAEPGDDGNAGK